GVTQNTLRVAYEILVLDVEPLIGGEFLAPRRDRPLAESPALRCGEDVRRAEGGVEIVAARVTAVTGDEYELRVREVLEDLLDEEEVVRRLLAPAQLVTGFAGIALLH